jgi:glycosyltransferase involved in cell wall biosynthesis
MTTVDSQSYRVAVILPCYNEAAAIADVVRDFRSALPQAVIYVYDNNSKDRTVECARAAGAVVRRETRQGKGHVVRRMFADVEADIYVLADGDGTYDAASAPAFVEKLINEQLDMVVGSRLTTYESEAFRRGHRFGNDLLTGFLGLCFGPSPTSSPATACSRGAS